MNVLIVYAHPEPKSFSGAMRDAAVEELTKQGHQVQVSDLYAMGWNPVAGQGDVTDRQNPDFFKLQVEQKHASETGTLAADIKAEQDKLAWCDTLILQFPMWWFSLPAILKGWIDRVFTTGFAYGGGKWFDEGPMRGKRAMLAVTTGAPLPMYEPDGRMGDIQGLLFHVNHGMLFFCGFDVLQPFVGFAPAYLDDQTRGRLLDQWRDRLTNLDTLAPLPYPKLAEFGPDLRLKR